MGLFKLLQIGVGAGAGYLVAIVWFLIVVGNSKAFDEYSVIFALNGAVAAFIAPYIIDARKRARLTPELPPWENGRRRRDIYLGSENIAVPPTSVSDPPQGEQKEAQKALIADSSNALEPPLHVTFQRSKTGMLMIKQYATTAYTGTRKDEYDHYIQELRLYVSVEYFDDRKISAVSWPELHKEGFRIGKSNKGYQVNADCWRFSICVDGVCHDFSYPIGKDCRYSMASAKVACFGYFDLCFDALKRNSPESPAEVAFAGIANSWSYSLEFNEI